MELVLSISHVASAAATVFLAGVGWFGLQQAKRFFEAERIARREEERLRVLARLSERWNGELLNHRVALNALIKSRFPDGKLCEAYSVLTPDEWVHFSIITHFIVYIESRVRHSIIKPSELMDDFAGMSWWLLKMHTAYAAIEQETRVVKALVRLHDVVEPYISQVSPTTSAGAKPGRS